MNWLRLMSLSLEQNPGLQSLDVENACWERIHVSFIFNFNFHHTASIASKHLMEKQLRDENELKETKIITALNEEGQEENHCQPSGALGLEFGHQDGGMSRQCLRAFAVSNHKPNKGTWSGRGIWTMLWQVNAGLWQETIGQE
ncbi:hypothetical protein SAY86_009566 [Trapa natans]|uniref:Uncharacterized protein n=1 Tax=Trapa natans TaxID=22666 RepID=A0AAN7QRC7_TRANT|nr:hypothetical protein SAY86_009566 [Trapa natans]